MISRFTASLRLPGRSRGGKDSGSVSKRARAQSYDSGTLVSSNVQDSPRKSKENAGNGQVSAPGSAREADDADRPPLKEMSDLARPGDVGGGSPSLLPAQLEARQQEEKDFIRRNDTAEANVWYLVDTRWLQEWKHFVTRNAPAPGPIDNSRLLDRNGAPRLGLRPVDDYRGVNGAIWNFWQSRYGGGPAIMRRQLDLHSKPIREDEASTTVTPNSSETGSERPRSDLSLPSSNGRSDMLRSSDSGRGRRGEEVPSPPRGRPVDRPSSQTDKRRTSAQMRTASAPAKDRDNDEDDTPKKSACCDKCDGPHETDDCPHFRGSREKHADAWTSYGKKATSDSNEEVHIVRHARVVSQPGDGSCLFHSLSYGLSDRSTASSLRRDICRYVESNPDISIADTTLKDWIRYDSGGTVQSYAQRMAGSVWGGGIEMAALTQMKGVNVHVYEKCEDGYMRISSFDHPKAQKTISVLYQGRMHYDAIDIRGD